MRDAVPPARAARVVPARAPRRWAGGRFLPLGYAHYTLLRGFARWTPGGVDARAMAPPRHAVVPAVSARFCSTNFFFTRFGFASWKSVGKSADASAANFSVPRVPFCVANRSRSKSLQVSRPSLSTSGGSVSAYNVFNAPQTARTHFSRSSRSSCCSRQTAARTPWPVISFGVFGSQSGRS